MSLSQKDKWMSVEVISALRARWPRHTAKHVAKRWGRAVVTAKWWLRNGVPEYLLQTILADLDAELAQMEEELTAQRAALRRARHEAKTAGAGGAVGARRGQGDALGRAQAAGRQSRAGIAPLKRGRR